jgi:spore germination protein GerM
MNKKIGKKRSLSSPAICFILLLFTIPALIIFSACEALPIIEGPAQGVEEEQGAEEVIEEVPQQDMDTKDSQDQTDEASQEDDDGSGEAEEEAEDEPGEAAEDAEEASEENQTQDNQEGLLEIKVYYADSQGEYLVSESRSIMPDNRFVDALLELIKNPESSDLLSLVPGSTVINSVLLNDNIANVDLASNFIDDRFISETVDILLVYSVVNTLTEFDEIDAVIFYINGQKLDTLGSLDVSGPIFRRNDLIKD